MAAFAESNSVSASASEGHLTAIGSESMVNSNSTAAHAIAVVGGAAAGAEVAAGLACRGIRVVVFEQNPRPFGKIEDCLPRWHAALRHKEYVHIVSKLTSPGVELLPSTPIGHALPLDSLLTDWGFSGVVLACGASRDRPLGLEGAARYVGKGLVYQNALLRSFNHHDGDVASSRASDGLGISVRDNAIIVGGGLASIDVAKVHTLETTRIALARQGIEVDLLDLERAGIPRTLARFQQTWSDLGLAGATVFYRRRLEDMPLANAPRDATEAQRLKVEAARRRIVARATAKYCFEVVPLARPRSLLTQGDRLIGLRFERMAAHGRTLCPTDECFDVHADQIVSSIGSVPAPIPGVPMRGEFFDFVDSQLALVRGHERVFAAGDVVTGKGNISASRKHGTRLTEYLSQIYLGLEEDAAGTATDQLVEVVDRLGSETTVRVLQALRDQPLLGGPALDNLQARVRHRQRQVGYTGDLRAWLAHCG